MRRDPEEERIIKKRLNTLRNLCSIAPEYTDKLIAEGRLIPHELTNNNMMNKYTHEGTPRKTKTRKAHSVYRAKLGGFGAAKQYSKHDKQQLAKENDYDE